MLAWEEPLGSSTEESASASHTHGKWREKFLKKLSRSGLLQEKVITTKWPVDKSS